MYYFQSSSSNGTVCSSSNKKNGMSKRPLGVTCTSSNDGKGKGRGSAVRLSTDPQSVAARERRHRISERFKTLQSLVPGGSKMDTVSMLEEAIQYVKFLKAQIWLHQNIIMINDALSNINDHNNNIYHDHDRDRDRDHDRTVFLAPADHHDIPISNMGCFHEPPQVPPQPDRDFQYYSCFQNYETTSFDHVNINNSYVKY